ncbi:MAG: CPBP family intramembrane metalloprotease [Chloroflexi bacterium]|nr:MAG: CPBP family intramembrane metalloprotease [Chloroflexota bacterium]
MLKKLAKLEPAPPWSYLNALTAFIGMVIAVMLIGATVALTLFGDETPSTLIVGWSIGMLLTVIFVMGSYSRRDDWVAAMRIAPTRARLPIIGLFAFGMAVLFDLIGWLIVNEQTLSSAELIRYATSETDITVFGWLIAAVFLLILQPIGEELVLRGVMYPSMRAPLGAWLGFAAVAAFHALFHFAVYTPPGDNQTILIWYGLLLPFLDGLLLTGIRAYTGSTRAAIIAHVGINIFILIKAITFAM